MLDPPDGPDPHLVQDALISRTAQDFLVDKIADMVSRYLLNLVVFLALPAAAQPRGKAFLPDVQSAVNGVSEGRLAEDMKALAGFETRDSNGLVEGPGKGVRAAREWIAAEFRKASPRLQVRFDTHQEKKGGRLVRDTEIVNVVAVLPGGADAETHVVIGAHYDSMNMKYRAGTRQFDADATASASLAPGVSDNASGVACVLEMARLMSRSSWPKTLVFIAFAGEEQGLFGARGYAARAAREKVFIEAMFNVDTIGTEATGNGIPAGNKLNLYSGEPADGPSRTLARYVREMSQRYLPELEMNTVFRADRFGRGGDHTPFHQSGFAAVRFTTPAEQLEHQHNELDTLDRASPKYVALATRGIAAGFASLAAAPRAPQPRPLGRGASRYDAELRWTAAPSAAAYAVFMRSTTAPYWEREYPAGTATGLTLKNVSIDEWTFGVRAIAANGAESLIVPWTLRPSSFTAPATRPQAAPSSAR